MIMYVEVKILGRYTGGYECNKIQEKCFTSLRHATQG